MIRLVYRPSPGTKLENLTVGVIQDYMVEAEKRMFAELVRDKRLGQDAYLPKDGSLEYKIMKSGREDLRTLQKIKHNYSWVIGVSKSFNPESCLDHTGKPNSNYIADLPVFQRFIRYLFFMREIVCFNVVVLPLPGDDIKFSRKVLFSFSSCLSLFAS